MIDAGAKLFEVLTRGVGLRVRLFRVCSALSVCLLALLSLTAGSCNGNTKPSGNGSEPKNGGEPEKGSRLDYQVEDRGQLALVSKYLDALAAGDVLAAASMLTPWAKNEAEIQYRTRAAEGSDGFSAYVQDSRTVVTTHPRRERPEGLTRPYQRPDDRARNGTFVEVVLVRQTPPAARHFAFYIEPDAVGGGFRIDNILTGEPLTVPGSAPAINPGMPTLQAAWLVYYSGVFLARHPFHEPLPTDQPLDMPARITYLRSVCTPAFMQKIVKDYSGNVSRFIKEGEDQFVNHLNPPLTEEGPTATSFYVTFVVKKTGVSLGHLLDAVRLHGQWRLNSHTEVDRAPSVRPQ